MGFTLYDDRDRGFVSLRNLASVLLQFYFKSISIWAIFRREPAKKIEFKGLNAKNVIFEFHKRIFLNSDHKKRK